jgi:hypothetical protein
MPSRTYVIAHELLHMKIKSHGRVFRSLLSAHVPTWRRFCPMGLETSCASRWREDVKETVESA